MALVTKMNRCAVCGSGQISLMADGKYYHCEACGATSNHTMPAADLAKVDRISLMGGSTEEIEALRHRYPPSGSHHLDQGESGTAVTPLLFHSLERHELPPHR